MVSWVKHGWACDPIVNQYLASVVQKMDNAIHRISHYPAYKHQQNQLSYPVDNAIHPSNNWGLVGSQLKRITAANFDEL